MKKYLLALGLAISGLAGNAQTMHASIGTGTNANAIRIYLRPSNTQNAVISTLQFNVAIPTSITPVPTLQMVTNGIAGVSSWIIDPGLVEGGYINYNIYTAAAGYNLNCVANTEIMAMELQFIGGPPGLFANTAHLVTLPDGGQGGVGQSLYYCSGTISSNGQDLYYARDGSVQVANGDSYRPTPILPGGIRGNAPAGTFTSYARLTTAIAVPVKFTGFSVVKKDNDAKLNWAVEGESAVTDRYEIERSTNGVSFNKIAEMPPKNNGQSANVYDMLDYNLSSIKSSGIVYYRVKQVDKDGKFAYTETRSVRLDSKFYVSAFPNPASNFTFVGLDKITAGSVKIIISDAAGSIVQVQEFNAPKGRSNRKIDMSRLVAGTYLFTIQTESEQQTLSVVKTN